MKISIITATYNCISVIGDCIKSVKIQTHQDIEHLIIDGSSSDGTLKLLKKNENNFSKILSEPDKGIYDALNKGISLSSGDVIGILHSDDIFADKKVLESVSKIFHDYPNIDVVIGDAIFFDRTLSNIKKRVIRSSRFRPWMLRFGFMPAHTATFIRRSALKRLGQYRDNYESAGDFEFFIRIFQTHKLQCHNLNKILVFMRLGGKSTSGMSSYLRTSFEILSALREHGIYSNVLLIFLRLPIKWLNQWIFSLLNLIK